MRAILVIFASIVLLISVQAYADLPVEGDFNGDGKVDFTDFRVITNEWLEVPPADPNGDLNHDGVIDFRDIAIFANHWTGGPGGSGSGPLVLEFPGDLNSPVACVRDSEAYIEVNQTRLDIVAPNIGRTIPICLSTRPSLVMDHSKNFYCQGIDGNTIICSDSKKLYTTTPEEFGDGTNAHYDQIVDIAHDVPFRYYYYYDAATINSFHIMMDGSWILCLASGYGQGYLFRSVDKGTSWSVCTDSNDGTIFVLVRGSVPVWGWTGVAGNEVVIGEYASPNQYDNPRRIYYSDDYGASWTKIFEPPAQYGRHCHLVTFAPNNTSVIYISYGDGDYKQLVKAVFDGGNKKDPANWHQERVVLQIAPTSVYAEDNYLYFGRDGLGAIQPILRLDTSNDSWAKTLIIPARQTDSQGSPYILGNNVGNVFGIFKDNGVFYACMAGTTIPNGSDQLYGGLYVSIDGLHWVCAYRTIHHGPLSAMSLGYGVFNIIGKADGYIWGTFMEAEGDRTRTTHVLKISPISAVNATAVMTESRINNLLSREASQNFSGTVGPDQWRVSGYPYNNGVISRSNETSLVGDYSLKFEGRDNNGNEAYVSSPSVWVNKGELVCGSCWVKCDANWPVNYEMRMFWSSNYIKCGSSDFLVAQNWRNIITWGTCDTSGYAGLRITFDSKGGGNYESAICYIDAAQIVKFPDFHYSGSWQIGETTRETEFIKLNLPEVGQPFTTAFEWHPLAGEGEFKKNVPIACWMNTDGNYVNLSWNWCTEKFVISEDGNDIGSSINSYPFQHPDFFRFAFVYDGVNYTFYIQSSLYDIESISIPSPPGGIGVLSSLILGSDNVQEQSGCGCYSKVKLWRVAFTASDIENLFMFR